MITILVYGDRQRQFTGAPVEIPAPVLRFCPPAAVVKILVISLFIWRRAVSRWAGGILLVRYAAFVVGGGGAVGMFS